jgi:hypothetical protein
MCSRGAAPLQARRRALGMPSQNIVGFFGTRQSSRRLGRKGSLVSRVLVQPCAGRTAAYTLLSRSRACGFRAADRWLLGRTAARDRLSHTGSRRIPCELPRQQPLGCSQTYSRLHGSDLNAKSRPAAI